jgi:hypothetical protein
MMLSTLSSKAPAAVPDGAAVSPGVASAHDSVVNRMIACEEVRMGPQNGLDIIYIIRENPTSLPNVY